MSFLNKRIIYRIGLYGTAILIAFTLYARANMPAETDEEYCKRKGMVKIHGRFYKYDVFENNEMAPISDMLTKECQNDPFCEIDHAYQYVLSIPYKDSTTNRSPADVINQNGGDCDEKSFLLATLLRQKNYHCLLVTTKDHGFIVIRLADESKIKRPARYLTYNNEHYYFAETTFTNGYIGKDNGIDPKEVEGIFNMATKQEIGRDEVAFSSLPSK